MPSYVPALALLLLAGSGAAAPVPASCLTTAASSTAPSFAVDFLVCRYCQTPRFRLFASEPAADDELCGGASSFAAGDPDAASSHMAAAILGYAQIQGEFWENATKAQLAVAHLLRFMPVRDSMRLMGGDDRFLDFLLEHVRYALLVRAHGPHWATNATLVSDAAFHDYVLPYAFLDEKRDVSFGWRRRFYQLFLANVSATGNATAAMHVLAAAIPHAAAAGVLMLGEELVAGSVVRWKSETSPMRMSPEQVRLRHRITIPCTSMAGVATQTLSLSFLCRSLSLTFSLRSLSLLYLRICLILFLPVSLTHKHAPPPPTRLPPDDTRQ